jgi:hypothetical protein
MCQETYKTLIKKFYQLYIMPIKTIHNCTCLPTTNVQGKSFKGCVFGSNTDTQCPPSENPKDLNEVCDDTVRTQWCKIKEKDCGYYNDDNGSQGTDRPRWDFCEYPMKFAQDDKKSTSTPLILDKLYYALGVVIFLFVFGGIIPYIFMKLGWIELIEVWVTNLDLLATALSFRDGLFGTGLFAYLYRLTDQGEVSYWSTLAVNYVALLGVCLVVAHRVYRTKSISHGWAIATIMLLVTYLIPNEIIREYVEKTYHIIQKYLGKDKAKSSGGAILHQRFETAIPIIVGLLIATGFLLLEKFIIRVQLHHIERFAEYILKPMNLKNIRVEFETCVKERTKH